MAGVGASDRGWGQVAWAVGRVWGNVAGLGACGRVLDHVAGGGGMSQRLGAYGRRGLGTCGRGWGHVAGCRGIW